VLAEVGYDTALDRLNTYTDDNGGTWKLSAPVTDGGADDLRRTVTVTDPAERTWFYEYDALGGWLLRSGRPNGLGVRPEDLPLPNADGEFDWHSLEGMVIRSYTHDADGRMTKVTDEMTDVTSVIHDDPYLSKAAQSAGKTQRVQKEMDDLVQKVRIGNTNPGLGN
jgi:hypothetical protein